jgi:hypothetical protein
MTASLLGGWSPRQTWTLSLVAAVELGLVGLAGTRHSGSGALIAFVGALLTLGGLWLALFHTRSRPNRLLGVGIVGVGLATMLDRIVTDDTRDWTQQTTSGLLILAGACLLLSWWYRWRGNAPR